MCNVDGPKPDVSKACATTGCCSARAGWPRGRLPVLMKGAAMPRSKDTRSCQSVVSFQTSFRLARKPGCRRAMM